MCQGWFCLGVCCGFILCEILSNYRDNVEWKEVQETMDRNKKIE